jgi:preprotein translocase subunit SecY
MVSVAHDTAWPRPAALPVPLYRVDRLLRVLLYDNLKKHGGFIPGIRPGERTAEYIDYVLSRITVLGAAYLAIVCLIPEILISYASVPFYFGGTSLLIVVSVTMDTVAQVQGYLLAHQYEGLIRKSKLRGRRK